ncbi:MAG: hypothetical protein HC817_02710 [Saprospiraceae bacterium]|nr:hypothetical protein [Saprospiraceae bacterium]
MLFIATIILYTTTYSQQTAASQANTAMLNNQLMYPMQQNSNILMAFNERYDGLEGNRFFYDTLYHTGKMHMTEGRNYFDDNYKYKFDQLAGSVQALRPDGKEILLDVNEVVMFEMFIGDKSVFFSKSEYLITLNRFWCRLFTPVKKCVWCATSKRKWCG